MPKKEKQIEEVEIIKVDDQKDKKEILINKNKEDSKSRSFLFPRVIAYCIDIMVISMICSLIFMVFPKSDQYDRYVEEYHTVKTEFQENKITNKEYSEKSIDLVYNIDHSNIFSMIVEVTLLVIYFSVFQFYNKGQTIGKKLMKLKVESIKDEKPTLNTYIIRSLIIHSLFIKLLIIGMVLVVSKEWYYYGSSFLQTIQILIVVVSIIIMAFRKDGRGLHDILVNTKVVTVGSK